MCKSSVCNPTHSTFLPLHKQAGSVHTLWAAGGGTSANSQLLSLLPHHSTALTIQGRMGLSDAVLENEV